MTGYGASKGQSDQLHVAVEIRAVNNRYLKINTRLPDALAALESEVERVVRGKISRGTVTVGIDVRSGTQASGTLLNAEVLGAYWNQIRELSKQLAVELPRDLSGFLTLPGVVTDDSHIGLEPERDWPLLNKLLEEAIEKFIEFRAREGRSMADDLRRNAQVIRIHLDEIAKSAQDVVRQYRDKLLERIRELLQGTSTVVNDSDLIREVSLFADRCDINEEITRLRCHLEQFDAFLNDQVSQGRKLDFLTQEMFREINTIGSKASNVSLAHSVVEMKASLERIREVLQNVE
jgi:uncharacterized protein (TIGR00255 family)